MTISMSVSPVSSAGNSAATQETAQLNNQSTQANEDNLRISFGAAKKATGTPENLQSQFSEALEKSFDSLKMNREGPNGADPVAAARNELLPGPASLRTQEGNSIATESLSKDVDSFEGMVNTLNKTFDHAIESSLISNVTTSTGKSVNTLTRG